MPSDETSIPPTELVAGFQIERQLGEGVWAALQPELGRRVALRRLAPGAAFSAAQWPERPGVIGLYAVVEDADGTYIATQFVDGGRTLAERRAAGARAADVRRWIDEAAVALDGAAHGNLTAHDILVDGAGRARVTGFGRAPGGTVAAAAADRVALQHLRPARRRRTLRWGVSTAAVAAGVGAILVATVGGDDGASPDPTVVVRAPPLAAGATAIGSGLGAVDRTVTTVDCGGAQPSGSSEPCTIMQATLPDRTLVAPGRGFVRSWAVQGATGQVALQILRPVGDRYVAYNSSGMVSAGGAGGTRVFPADLSVPAGARFALEVAPGAGVGLRRGVAGTSTSRFFGPLRGVPRDADRSAGRTEELLLRVDVVPQG